MVFETGVSIQWQTKARPDQKKAHTPKSSTKQSFNKWGMNNILFNNNKNEYKPPWNILFICKKEKPHTISSEELIKMLSVTQNPLYSFKHWFQQRQWRKVTKEKASLFPGRLYKSPDSPDSLSADQKGLQVSKSLCWGRSRAGIAQDTWGKRGEWVWIATDMTVCRGPYNSLPRN